MKPSIKAAKRLATRQEAFTTTTKRMDTQRISTSGYTKPGSLNRKKGS